MTTTSTGDRLQGLRIALSGSVPERKFWRTPSDDLALLQFVRTFAGSVFHHGGRVVHGCHPSLTPVLVGQAERFGQGERGEAPLILLMSEVWASSLPADVGAWYDRHAEFWVVRRGAPSEGDADGKQASLSALRRELVAIGNVFVAAGGKHQGVGKHPGVDEEVALAAARRRPTFLLGALGGRTASLPSDLRQRLFDSDLLPAEARREFAEAADPSRLVGRLLAHLLRHRDELLAFSHRDVRVRYRDFRAGALGDGGDTSATPTRLPKKMLDLFLERVLERTTVTVNNLATAMHTRSGRLQRELLAAVRRRAAEQVFEAHATSDPDAAVAPLVDKIVLEELPKAWRAAAGGTAEGGAAELTT